MAGLIWFSWIQPYRTWTHPVWHYIKDAEKAYRKHRLDIWIPVLLSIALSFCGLLLVIEEWFATGQFQFDDMAMQVTYGLLAITVPIAIPCYWISRYVDKCFRELMSAPHCIACGYNLKGNPDAQACPECGAEVPQLKDTQYDPADHPGQGPAGHDRA